MTRDPRERDGRVVTLRNETDGSDSRHLWAHLDQKGNPHNRWSGPGSEDGDCQFRRGIRVV